MERIKPLRRYTLIDRHRNALHLFLGQEEGHAKTSKDKGFRWMLKGHKIPMPVRSEGWFNGFPVDTMLDWFKENGWSLHSELDLATNRLVMYKYVCMNEVGKGNETTATIAVNPDDAPKGNETYELTELSIRNGNEALTEAIKILCSKGVVLKAINLCRLVHPCCLKDAKEAVDKIRFP